MFTKTLLGRTSLTLALALTAFTLFAAIVAGYYLLVPVAKRAADDLASLMVLSAKAWIELAPDARNKLESELERNHGLRIVVATPELPLLAHKLPYFYFLEQSLAKRVGQEIELHTGTSNDDWYWADIPIDGFYIRTGFDIGRLGARLPPAFVLIIVGAFAVILVAALAHVHRLTRPLQRLSDAAERLGRGELHIDLPESSPRELARLERSFNHMAHQLRELLVNRTTLLAGISHDLRTPLARMYVKVKLLIDRRELELLPGLERDLRQMDQLIVEALEFAQVIEIRETTEVDLLELIDGLVIDARQGGGDVRWTPRGSCYSRVAVGPLRRIVNNLIDNAIRYGAGNPIEVRCSRVQSMAIIEIADRGPGIPESQREAVFRPFYRLESSRSRDTGGSGLGLGIARQLADTAGWSLTLLPRDGGGTIARLELAIETEK